MDYDFGFRVKGLGCRIYRALLARLLVLDHLLLLGHVEPLPRQRLRTHQSAAASISHHQPSKWDWIAILNRLDVGRCLPRQRLRTPAIRQCFYLRIIEYTRCHMTLGRCPLGIFCSRGTLPKPWVYQRPTMQVAPRISQQTGGGDQRVPSMWVEPHTQPSRSTLFICCIYIRPFFQSIIL